MPRGWAQTRVPRVFPGRWALLPDTVRSERPALEMAQDCEGDQQASNNAPKDRHGSQPNIGGLNDLPGLIGPAQRECETAKECEASLAVLTAAQISAQDRIEVFENSSRARVQQDIRITCWTALPFGHKVVSLLDSTWNPIGESRARFETSGRAAGI